MVLVALALLLHGCGGPALPEKAAPHVAPSSARPEAPALKAAPTRAFYGLTLGESDDGAMRAWLAANRLTCKGDPAARRKDFRYTCAGDLPVEVLPDGTINGRLCSLRLVRADPGPLRQISSRRLYRLPADAVADYNSARAALVDTFGAPARGTAVPSGARLDGKLLWYASEWHFSDLNVRVQLLRGAGSAPSVSEEIDVPGADGEDRVEAGPTDDTP